MDSEKPFKIVLLVTEAAWREKLKVRTHHTHRRGENVQQPFEVSMAKFRQAVDDIKDDQLKVKVQLGYLLAARNCELCSRVNKGELLNHRSRNYGVFMEWDGHFRDFIIQPTEPLGIQLGLKEPYRQKVVVFQVAAAKRGKRVKTQKPTEEAPTATPAEVEEALRKYRQAKLLEQYKKGLVTLDPLLVKALNDQVFLRYVAIPVGNQYEPWLLPILKYWQENNHSLSIPITRRYFYDLLHKALSNILPQKHYHGKESLKNPIRHIRISHLLQYYDFSPLDINAYTGWALSSIFAQLGQPISNNLERYSHLTWRMYVPKLCVNIDKLTGKAPTTVQVPAQ